MKKSTAVFSAALSSILMSGMLTGSAIADESKPGVAFKAAHSADASCINTVSYGAIINDCTTSRMVVATLPNMSLGNHPTSVAVFGSNTWCQSVTTDSRGNGLHIGALTWTIAGPQTWQTLDTGDRTSLGWSPLTFRCRLEPGGMIGMLRAQ